MANTFITPTWVLKDVARVAVNMLKFAANIERWYDDKYKVGGAKAGYTVSRPPAAALPHHQGPGLPGAAHQRPGRARHADRPGQHRARRGRPPTRRWSSRTCGKRYIHPAAEQLANTIDFDGLDRMTPTVWKSVGTPGVDADLARDLHDRRGARLTQGRRAARRARRGARPDARWWTWSRTRSTLFNPSRGHQRELPRGAVRAQRARRRRVVSGPEHLHAHDRQLRELDAAGLRREPDRQHAHHQRLGGTATLNKGDVFTIAGVYEVNPQNYASTGQLQQFVVTATTTDSAGVDDHPDQPGDHPRRQPADRDGLAGQRRGDHPARARPSRPARGRWRRRPRPTRSSSIPRRSCSRWRTSTRSCRARR